MASVLVVDDSPFDRRLAGRLLEKSTDAQVYYAEDGRQALERVEEHLPDLVVTDLQMPEINGDEGPGFDPSLLPDPTDPENLARPHGRGLMLMRTFMDDLTFNSTGNEVRMLKRAVPAAGNIEPANVCESSSKTHVRPPGPLAPRFGGRG
jgi:hypothetical protein